jgi:hypothetical protein
MLTTSNSAYKNASSKKYRISYTYAQPIAVPVDSHLVPLTSHTKSMGEIETLDLRLFYDREWIVSWCWKSRLGLIYG